MSKRVSIVLPTYNGENFLRKSIESCLSQTYKNIELIVINDCSTDRTEEIILSFNDSRIIYHKNEFNQKLPRSLNIGFDLAKGDYLTWTSDDNYYQEDAIEKLVNELEEFQVDLAYASYWTIDEENKITGERIVGEEKDILLDNVVKACFLYKREVLEKIGGYNPDLFLVEDYDYWIRIVLNRFKIRKINEKLYYYRFHEGSLTETRRKQISEALYQLLSIRVKEFEQFKKKKYISGKVYLKLAKLSVIKNDGLAKKYISKAVSKTPRLILSKELLKISAKILFKNKLSR